MNMQLFFRLRKVDLKTNSQSHYRNCDGAILPLFAILAPVLILVAMIAINLATLQLARTELKVSTDAAARGGGRAWSITNDENEAVRFARIAALANPVNGNGLVLEEADIVFGTASRANGTTGRYQFTTGKPNGVDFLTAMRVNGRSPKNFLFTIANINSVELNDTAVTAHVDRDIALVIDRSGSMAYFYDEDFLYDTITEIVNANTATISDQEYEDAVADYQSIAELANLSLRQRRYSPSILQHLSGDLLEYGETLNRDYLDLSAAPRQSRWAILEDSTQEFFRVLQRSGTRQNVAVASFSSDGRLDLPLTSDIDLAQETVRIQVPDGSTAIGNGIQQGIDQLLANGREGAIPTVLVFSDGENRQGLNPIEVATTAIQNNPRLIINTVTFADGNPVEMAEVARIGNGVHFHANDGRELRSVFRTLAESFSTVIIE